MKYEMYFPKKDYNYFCEKSFRLLDGAGDGLRTRDFHVSQALELFIKLEPYERGTLTRLSYPGNCMLILFKAG